MAQLHHDNFLLFHSPRYTRHHYIYPNSNLRRILLEEWAERLTELGTFHRTAEDVEDRLGEMILEVAEYRRHMETPYRLQVRLVNRNKRDDNTDGGNPVQSIVFASQQSF